MNNDTTSTHNAAVEARVLAEWATRPANAVGYFSFPSEDEFAARTGPRQWRASVFPYRNGAPVTTWMGTVIGSVMSALVYRHNLGGRFVSLTIMGTNGATYSGRASWDNGNCINLHLTANDR
jgi:hypothetical protein